MTTGKRIWFSIVIGWSIKLVPLLIYALFSNQITGAIAAVANFDTVLGMLMAGKGPRFPDGGYEGTPIHIIFGLLGFLSGFVIYPIIIFAVMTLWQKFFSKKDLGI
jgi:hypothetical protein